MPLLTSRHLIAFSFSSVKVSAIYIHLKIYYYFEFEHQKVKFCPIFVQNFQKNYKF